MSMYPKNMFFTSESVTEGHPDKSHGIIDHLNLRELLCRNTAAYGHFGRSEFAWEKVDATEVLLAGARNA